MTMEKKLKISSLYSIIWDK
nr:unnamed protein product [Callosobruchus chinensis]